MASEKINPNAHYIVRHTGVGTVKPVQQAGGGFQEVLKEGHVMIGSDLIEATGVTDNGVRLLAVGAIEEAHPREVRNWQGEQEKLLSEETEPGAGAADPANLPENPNNDALGGGVAGQNVPIGTVPIVQTVPPETNEDGSPKTTPDGTQSVPPAPSLPATPPASEANAADATSTPRKPRNS